MIKVLFVCMGNICRSPMAEAVFQEMVNQAGLQDHFLIDSAGTGDWHAGEAAHEGTLEVLRKRGVRYNGRSRQIRRQDMDEFDYILTMDSTNLRVVQGMFGPSPKLTMFLTFANDAELTPVQEVPDPYYTGRYEQVYELVNTGGAALIAYLRAEHHL